VIETLVDPRVSRVKFEREVALYRGLERDYVRRGWWMLRADFPEVLILFGTDKLRPPAVVFGALIDFTNYDLWPPSVTLVHPFTAEPYKFKELPSQLPRRLPSPPQVHSDTHPTNGTGPTQPTDVQSQGITVQAMMQAFSEDHIPFLCLAGVREYHNNPGHTGDSWFLHRGTGAGTLNSLLEQLYKYGVKPMRQIHQFQVQTHFVPAAEEIPE
jgi:hypothetical protein